MFKRVLVLVVFLFGVFWWLTSRDNKPAEPSTDVVVVEVEEAKEGAADETDADTKASEESEEVENKEAVEASTEKTFEATTPTKIIATAVAKPSPVVSGETPVAEPVAPVAPTPIRVVAKPVVIEVPDRTTDVKIYTYEWGLDMSDKTIPAGTINFKVQNDGRFTHDFNVSGFGNLGKVMPSETKTFTVKLAAGEYEAFSERRQDYERGVRENFVVVE